MGAHPPFAVPPKHLGPVGYSQVFDLSSRDAFSLSEIMDYHENEEGQTVR